MPSIGENLMLAIQSRLEGSPAVANFRRAHRIPVAREEAPAVHQIDGADTPESRPKNDCRTQRTKLFTISVFERDDNGAAAADPLVVEVNARLDPLNAAYTPYPHGATLYQGAITPNEEIADGDAVRIDMDFSFEYKTTGWTLA